MAVRRPKTFALIILLACGITVVGAGWMMMRAVAWVKDLPNRIVFETDGNVSAGINDMIVQSFHAGLKDGEVETQRHLLESLTEWVAREPNTASWLRQEFLPDIQTLSDSPDPQVAAAAKELQIHLSAAPLNDALPTSTETLDNSAETSKKPFVPAVSQERMGDH